MTTCFDWIQELIRDKLNKLQRKGVVALVTQVRTSGLHRWDISQTQEWSPEIGHSSYISSKHRTFVGIHSESQMLLFFNIYIYIYLGCKHMLLLLAPCCHAGSAEESQFLQGNRSLRPSILAYIINTVHQLATIWQLWTTVNNEIIMG